MEKIMVIGSSNTDLLIKTDRIPDPGETVLGGTFMMNAGGKGANQAVAVARMGGDVIFVTRIGDDMFGRGSLAGYERDGIDVSHIIKDKAAPSGVALITVDAKGENCIVVAPGANNRLLPADIDAVADAIRHSEYLLMQMEIPMETIEHAAAIACEAGKKVVLNPAPAACLSDRLLSGLYLITPNRSESRLLTGVTVADWESAERAADVLLERGVGNVVITLGSLGSLVRNRELSERVPACRVEAVDTTAAGDVFNGALCVALAEGRTLVEAVRFATRASAISVTRMGAQSSIPTRSELDSFN
ncbi:ribokinase [uncultured Alistipes sp.]|uniref:ribokinase n=1 Tax=uncultured Alistipes sp. TaxID=538949 RepID=UPI002639D629|nr:ribokinase [uncultured Alistipes sp.]